MLVSLLVTYCYGPGFFSFVSSTISDQSASPMVATGEV